MNKLFSGLVALSFALASGAAFSAAHTGMKDDKAMEEKKAACAKADAAKMDDKMKAECKAMMDKKS